MAHDIMVLLECVNMNINSFNESCFLIFAENDREPLKELYSKSKSMQDFVFHLSPEQSFRLSEWAIEKTAFKREELITALEKFTKYLKKQHKDEYPVRKRHMSVFGKKSTK